jgi:hypothetical protein
MRYPGPKSPRAVIAVLALALAAAACGTSTAGGSPSPASRTAVPSTSPAAQPSPPGAAPSAGCDTRAWQTVPVAVTRDVAVPPVPVITAVRTAAHPECGYDRLVLDITGPLPGYALSYRTQVTADPSGQAITMPGRRFLVITLRPAQAHGDSGSPAVPRTVQRTGYPGLLSWALAGDFESVVTVAAGLPGTASVRVAELPGRLYIDLKR